MKVYIFFIALSFLAIACNSKQKTSTPQSEAQDSTQVAQPDLPPLEAGEVEYKDESMFGEIIELEGRLNWKAGKLYRPIHLFFNHASLKLSLKEIVW